MGRPYGNNNHYVHGLRRTRLYSIWANIKTRCYNVNDPHYKRWGAKGVVMCDEWKNDFTSFYNWALCNGYSDELTIDRVDGGGISRSNSCRLPGGGAFRSAGNLVGRV